MLSQPGINRETRNVEISGSGSNVTIGLDKTVAKSCALMMFNKLGCNWHRIRLLSRGLIVKYKFGLMGCDR